MFMMAKEVHRSRIDLMEKERRREEAKVSSLRNTTRMLPTMQVKKKPMTSQSMKMEIGKNKKNRGMKKRTQHIMPKRTTTHSKNLRNLPTRTLWRL